MAAVAIAVLVCFLCGLAAVVYHKSRHVDTRRARDANPNGAGATTHNEAFDAAPPPSPGADATYEEIGPIGPQANTQVAQEATYLRPGAEAFAPAAPEAAYSLATDGGIVAEGQYNTVDDALTFLAEGGLALTLYADGSSTAA